MDIKIKLEFLFNTNRYPLYMLCSLNTTFSCEKFLKNDCFTIIFNFLFGTTFYAGPTKYYYQVRKNYMKL